MSFKHSLDRVVLKQSANSLILECVLDRRSEERISLFNSDMLTFFIFLYCIVLINDGLGSKILLMIEMWSKMQKSGFCICDKVQRMAMCMGGFMDMLLQVLLSFQSNKEFTFSHCMEP